MENKNCEILGNVTSIYWQEFRTILGDGVEQYLSLFYFLFVGAWILWQGSHFFGCSVVRLHWLEGGICRAGWENKPLWEFEPMKDGTLGNQPPHISNLCSVKGQCAQQKRIYWGLILFEILYIEKFSINSD